MKKKHIVIVTPYYAPAWAYGGPPRVLSTLAEELTKQKLKVSVITTDSLGQNRCDLLREKLNGVEISRFPTISNYLSFTQKLFFIPNLLAQSQTVLDTADAVLFSDTRALLSWQIFPYLKQRQIPYGVFLYGQVERGEGVKAFVKQTFDWVWVKSYIASATWIFAQTDHEKKVAVSILGADDKKVFLSLLPIPSLPNKKNISIASFRQKFRIKPTDKVVIFVGRLHYLKGVDILLGAVIPILKKNRAVKLIVVGRDDGVEAQLQSQVPKSLKNQVNFTGPLYEQEAREAYMASNLFVFTPRFFEETSTAALEALSLGVPVVTTQQADIPYLEKYKAGQVVSNDIKHIQDAIRSQLSKSGTQIKSNSRRLIKDKYLAIGVAKQLLKDMKI